MYYKNISCSEKTFHGVTFKPGDIAEVTDFINNPFMILVDGPIKTDETIIQQKPSVQTETEVPEPEELSEESPSSDLDEVISAEVETKEEKKRSGNKERKS